MDAVDRLTYSLAGIPRFRIKGLSVKVGVNLGITNPTDQPLFFDRIDLAATHNTSTIGSVFYDKRTIVAAKATTVVPFEFTPSLGNVAKALISAISGGDPGTLSITGTITAGPLKIPITQEIRLKKKDPSDKFS